MNSITTPKHCFHVPVLDAERHSTGWTYSNVMRKGMILRMLRLGAVTIPRRHQSLTKHRLTYLLPSEQAEMLQDRLEEALQSVPSSTPNKTTGTTQECHHLTVSHERLQITCQGLMLRMIPCSTRPRARNLLWQNTTADILTVTKALFLSHSLNS